jgi:hypothetical protein
MIESNLFSGIAVLIDDQVEDGHSRIGQIRQAILASGSHVIALDKAPTEEQIATLSAISYFIVDWNLEPVQAAPAVSTAGEAAGEIPAPIALPRRLEAQNTKRTLALLENLRKKRVAPIFIFTDESVESVQEELKALQLAPGSHFLVKTKSEVLEKGVDAVLSEWIRTSPAAYVLMHWEQEYEKAKQDFFLDFYARSVEWPLILWKTFETDGAQPSEELGRVIYRNIQSRMTPFEFDLKGFSATAEDHESKDYKAAVLKVLEGERFIAATKLHSSSIAPGDVFKLKGDYYLNIRPECDCIVRDGTGSDALELYLLQGSKLSAGQKTKAEDPDFGLMRERDTHSLVYPIDGDLAVVFQFKEIHTKTWADLKDARIGRLLSPHLTRVQERFAAYMQRPGISRYPTSVFSKPAPQASAEATPAPKSIPEATPPPQTAPETAPSS